MGWGFERCRFDGEFRTHQAEALAAFDRVTQRDAPTRRPRDDHAERPRGRRAYLVLPPGAGKTLVGLEAARRLGRPTLVLGPNTAIQAQWLRAWERFTPRSVTATADRALPTPLTVLTYQAVAVFDPDAEVDEDGRRRRGRAGPGGLLARLHDNGRALVERMRAGGPWTLVLDECHHLLEVWGRLLVDLIEYVEAGDAGRVAVVGLTATPRTTLTSSQSALVRRLFGDITSAVSTPAVVRTGHVAPYQELAYLTTPTAEESEYIRSKAERFLELRTDLLDPDFGSTSFLQWCDRRFLGNAWSDVRAAEPALAAAALRLHHAGLLALPSGAVLHEEHRHEPTAEDWVALIEDYARHCLLPSSDPRDAQAYDAIRRALPAVGYTMTRRGVRASRSPVDRVLARSAAKTTAVTAILDAERQALGERLRAIVVCDHERASARLSARLTGVLDERAGSARLVLERLLDDPVTAALDPVLMTARTVACGKDTAVALLSWLAVEEPALALTASPLEPDGRAVELTGGWSARRWVPLVTRFFETGGARVLVGTRGLLGEGWDARAVNVVIDLTTATTPTAVVQIRGRGIRLDPDWPEKVTDTWTVTAVSPDHPKGAADYARFVAKHRDFLAVDQDGDITTGVPHVDPGFSPYAPPAVADFDAFNARALARVGERAAARERWAIGEPYLDTTVHALRVRSARTPGPIGADLAALAPPELDSAPRRRRNVLAGLVGSASGVVAGLLGTVPSGALEAVPAVVVPGVAALAAGGAYAGALVSDARRLQATPSEQETGLLRIATAVVEAMAECGVAEVDAGALRLSVTADGHHRVLLADVPPAVSEEFARALDETLSPLARPRYLVARFVTSAPTGLVDAVRLVGGRRLGLGVPGTVAWHAVPTVLGRNVRRARAFAGAWARHVGPTRLVATSGPEGAAVLETQRGTDPFAATTQLRVLWR